jgi:hypothetical protein
MPVCNHQEILDLLHRKDTQACAYEEIIDDLQKELCEMAMQPACNHEELLAYVFESYVHAHTHQEIVTALQQELFQARSVPPTCDHQGYIAALQQELYAAKQEILQLRAGHAKDSLGNRLETIVLRHLNAGDIPDAAIFEVLRKHAPRLRRDDLYACLRVLQERGWIQQTPESVWVRIRPRGPRRMPA